MQYDKVMIDLSNLFHRAFHVSSHMTHKMDDGQEMITGGVYTSLMMIRRLEREFLKPYGQMFFIFDNTHSGENKRKLIDPEYKSNREKKDDGFYRAMDFLHMILLNYKDNFVVVKRPGSEADDLVSPLIIDNPDDDILLVSNDLDWFRPISEKVHVAKYENKDYVIYDPETFKIRMGFEASIQAVTIYKAFRGDSSDNIPKGVSGIRENLLIELVNRFENVIDILKVVKEEEVDEIPFMTDTWKKKILQNSGRLLLNEKLVAFEPIPLSELKDYCFDCSFSPKLLKSLYKSLGFNYKSLDPRIESFCPDKKKSKGFFQYDTIPREK